MIIFENVTHIVGKGAAARTILSSVSLRIPPTKALALWSKEPADQAEIIKLLSGSIVPTAGRIIRTSKVSFPTGMLRAFDMTISLRHNLEYIARLYGVDKASFVGFLERTLKLKSAFDQPMAQLPSDVRRQISHIVPYSLPFDIYLTNGISGKTPKHLAAVSRALFDIRIRSSGFIIATRDFGLAQKYCWGALILSKGRLRLRRDIAAVYGQKPRVPEKTPA